MVNSEAEFALIKDAPYAVQLRLAPEMLASLEAAQASGSGKQLLQLDPATSTAILKIGGDEFHLKALPDDNCTVIRNTPASGEASVQGQVHLKLQPTRGLAGAKAAPVTLPKSIPSSKPMPSKHGPPLHQTQPSSAAAVVVHHGTSGRSTTLTPEEPSSGSRALAAARQRSLRLVLIALLSERSVSLRGIRQALDAIDKAVPGSKLSQKSKSDLELSLKSVAIYKAPGMYVLKEGLESDIQHLPVSPPLRQPLLEKRKRSPESNNEDGGPFPAARRRSTPSLPSTDEGGSSVRRAHSRPLSSSSRGSGGADEGWVVEHASRLPEPAPAMSTLEDYHAVRKEFNRRYEIYFKLHQHLAANRKDFVALQATVDNAQTAEDKAAGEEEVRRLWERRSGRAQRWQAAFKVLHAELDEWKAALDRYRSLQSPMKNGGVMNTQKTNSGAAAAELSSSSGSESEVSSSSDEEKDII